MVILGINSEFAMYFSKEQKFFYNFYFVANW